MSLSCSCIDQFRKTNEIIIIPDEEPEQEVVSSSDEEGFYQLNDHNVVIDERESIHPG